MSEKITFRNIADAAEEYTKLFGANKNLDRVIPSLQDGARPGKRRLFWAWWNLEGRPKDPSKTKFRKASSVGVAAMDYHPHGEDANFEILTREAQPWNNNIVTALSQGSVGSIRGDDPASGRYLEVKLSPYIIDCFFADFDKCCVPMKPSYNGEHMEPVWLPAKYPHLLFNPQIAGIGIGIASNIPPFNVTEVLKATIALIKNKDAKIRLIPDSPTGADVVDPGDGFKELNKYGTGKLTLQATTEIDYMNNIIKITSLPLQVESQRVINKIVEISKSKQLDEIVNINDYTKNGDVDLRFILRKDANPDKVLKTLFKKTDLRKTYSVDLIVVDDFKDYLFGVKDYLLEWIEFRRDVVRSMFNVSYQQLIDRQHINEILLLIFNKDNAEKTLKICKSSGSKKETIAALMKEYKGITSLQADTICNMRLYAFTKDSYAKYKADKENIKEELEKITEILEDDNKIDEYIINELKDGIKKYGGPRRSRVIKKNDILEDTFYMIGISEDGYIKKISDTASSIGQVGKGNRYSNILLMNSVSNRDTLLVVCSNGEMVPIKVSDIPDIGEEDIGIFITKLIDPKYHKDDNGLFIRVVMLVPPTSDIFDKDTTLALITESGYAKRVPLSDFKRLQNPISIISLSKHDRLIDAVFCMDDSVKDVIIYTNLANGVRLHISDIPTLSKTAKGKRQVSLKDGEHVVGLRKIDPKKKYLFMITSNGKAKITEMKYFPVMKRQDESLPLMSISGTESLVGVSTVGKSDILRIYKKKSEPADIKVSDISLKTRIAAGDKKVKVGRGDAVIGYSLLKK